MGRDCKDGFITTYLKYTSKQESPLIFHMWTALTILSAVLKRNVYMDRGYYTLYPNLYTVLVSPSGVGRKSSAMKLGMELIDKSGIDINTVRGKITATRLISRLAASQVKNADTGVASLFVYSEEFKVFTKGIMKDSSIIEDLTQLYDCGVFDYETEHQQQNRIKYPVMVILGGSTPEWLSGGSAGDLLSGGFGARIVPVCVMKDEKQIAWPKKTEVEMEMQAKLLHDLGEIANLSGKFYVPQNTMDFFEEWYTKREKFKLADERLNGYYAKKHDLILKLGMLMSVSLNDELVVSVANLELAFGLMSRIEETMTHAYTGAVFGVEAKHQEKVFSTIMSAGEEGLSHASLVRMVGFHMGAKQVRDAIDTLIAGEKIVREEVKTATKPRITYKVNKDSLKLGGGGGEKK